MRLGKPVKPGKPGALTQDTLVLLAVILAFMGILVGVSGVTGK